jgi:hypothetical protein
MDDFERRDGDEVLPEHIPDEPPNTEPEFAPDDTPRLGMIALDSVLEPDGELALTPEAGMDSAEAAAQASVLEPSISEKAKGKPDSHEARIEVLSLAIERYPEAAVNYVLRGEAWLAVGNRVNALDDFRAALALASDAVETARWGYVEQALADRAREGLRQLGI